MFEFAAFGFVTLVWWTWPAIAGIVFGSMWAALLLHDLRTKREESAKGPYPCMAYMGTDVSGTVDHWCWQREGHGGECVLEYGDTQVSTDSGLCTFGEDGNGNPNGCWKPAGHTGAHMILGQSEEF